MITEAEQKYIRLCEEVNERILHVYGAAGRGYNERAADLALALSDFVCDEKQAILMRHERTSAGAYDLAALKVNADTLTYSETYVENED